VVFWARSKTRIALCNAVIVRSLFGEISFAFLFLSNNGIGSFDRRIRNELDINSLLLLYISDIGVSALLDTILQLYSYANYISYAKYATDVIYTIIQNYAMNFGNFDNSGILISWKIWRKKRIKKTGKMCKEFNQ
jgi:hypothetical protein